MSDASDARSFRDRYPGPWTIEETPSGYKVSSGATTLCYIYVYMEPWENVATTGQRKLTRAEGLAMAKAVAALGDQNDAQGRKSARPRRPSRKARA